MVFSGMAHQAHAGHQAEPRERRSPDLQIRMAKIENGLADSKIIQ
jgi:hypothetical protein